MVHPPTPGDVVFGIDCVSVEDIKCLPSRLKCDLAVYLTDSTS
jgi:hypothetical protein